MTPARQEIRALVRLAWPVVAAQVGMVLFGLVDIWMLGRVGPTELAAAGLADACLFSTMMVGVGLVMGIDPIVAQAHGAGRGSEAGRALQHGIVVGLAASVPLTVAWLHVDDIMLFLGQAPELAALGRTYTMPQVWSIAPGMIYVALRQYLLCRGLMMPPLWIILAANIVNVPLNWVLIFGGLGIPALGVYGAGLATGIVRALMPIGLALLVFGRGLERGAWAPWSRAAFARADLLRVLAMGVPVALQIGLEVWAFNATTFIAGNLGAKTAAAHTVVLRLASLAFMVPLGISIAATTRVGNRLGANDRPGAQRAARTALALGAGVMCVSAVVFLLFPRELTSFFNDDARVVALGASIFPLAAAFQVFDGAQIVGCGILRGMGTPRPAAIFNFLGYYVIALPVGLLLAFPLGLGIRGVWLGLTAGLATVALLLLGWIVYRGPARVASLVGSASSDSAISAVE